MIMGGKMFSEARLYILERRIKEAWDEALANHDRVALIRDINEIQVIHNHVRKRGADIAIFENYEHLARLHLARLADYAMVFCRSLKAIEGTKLKYMFWSHIVDQLDQEL